MKVLFLLTQVICTIACKEAKENIDSSSEQSLYRYDPGDQETNDPEDTSCPYGYHRVVIRSQMQPNEKICVRDSRQNCSEYSKELGICNHCFNGYYLVKNDNKRKACYNINQSWLISGVTIGIIVGLVALLITCGVCCCCCTCFRLCCCRMLCCCFNKQRNTEEQIMKDLGGKYAQMV